jgi:MFS transporter, MHS family, proline/betaine transporter
MVKKIKLLLTASSGSLFETFDFYLFALFSVAISQAFLGGGTTTDMMWVFIVFASGYFARIMGALFFGYIGDKYGRAYAFRYTILVIALASIGIGLTPTYNAIGIFAIILLFSFRMAQGFSYGGELSGAIVMVYENSKKHRGFYCSVVLVCASLGVVAANLTHTGLEYWLSPEQMLFFGWRIAFIGGGLIIFHSYLARVTLYESETFKEIQHAKKNKEGAIQQIAKNYKALMLFVFFTQAGIASYWGILVAYLPAYCAEYCTLSTIQFAELMLVMAICIPIGNILGGLIADWIGIKKAYLIYSIIMLIIIMPIFNYIMNDAVPMINVLVLMGGFALLTGLMNGTANYFSANIFPAEIRYSSVAIIQSVGMALFAGLAPLYVSSLTHYFNDTMMPAKVLTIAYAVQVVAVLVIVLFLKKLKAPTEN